MSVQRRATSATCWWWAVRSSRSAPSGTTARTCSRSDVEARVEDGGLGVEPGGGGGELVALPDEVVLLAEQGVEPGDQRVDGGGGCPGTLEAGQRVGLGGEERVERLAGLGEGSGQPGLEATHLLGVCLDDDLEVVDLAAGLALGGLVGCAGRRRRGGGVVGRAAHRAAGADRQLARDLGSHAVEALLADLHERLAREQPRLRRRREVALGRGELGREVVGRAGGEHPRPDRHELAVEGGDLEHRLAGRGEPGLEVGQGLRHLRRPGGEPVELGRELLPAPLGLGGGPTRPR